MNMVYNLIEWDLLEQVMVRIGFDRKWVMLVMQYIKTVDFSVIVNGQLGKNSPISWLTAKGHFVPIYFPNCERCSVDAHSASVGDGICAWY